MEFSDSVTATVTITDKDDGNYTVSGSTTFTITAKPLTGAAVNVSGTFTYSGNAHTPEPTVTLGGRTLTKDTDYAVAYSDNVDAGTATVTITGKGNYSGTASGTFTIGRATLTADGTGIASGTYGKKLSELEVTGLTAKMGDTVVNGSWALTGETIPDVGDSKTYTAMRMKTVVMDNTIAAVFFIITMPFCERRQRGINRDWCLHGKALFSEK